VELQREPFEAQRTFRFGKSNPERMRFAFWDCWMVRERSQPYRVRELFNLSNRCGDEPIWSFDRMGVTRTELPDGRSISIGGEYEDFYDPDFCIYNDVIVQGPPDRVEIYGYPEATFPPTDFHTSTLADDRIFIVGSLGYPESRRPGHTPVYCLALANYTISELRTTGENPGWIFKHQASLETNNNIKIWGGEFVRSHGGRQQYRRLLDDFTLELHSLVWTRLEPTLHSPGKRWVFHKRRKGKS
jgi:hypothetical protein